MSSWISVRYRLPEPNEPVVVTDGQTVTGAEYAVSHLPGKDTPATGWLPVGVELDNPDRDEETACIKLGINPTHWQPCKDLLAQIKEEHKT